MKKYSEVTVIGGGPTGLASAIHLQKKNFNVSVFDKREPPINKPCGEGLMPEGVQELKKLGIEVNNSWAYPFSGIRYLDENITVEGTFLSGRGFGIRRTILHKRLSERASEIGVDLNWNVAVTGIIDDRVQTGRGIIETEWIIGADGLHSDTRQWSGLSRENNRKNRFGFVRHYSIEPWTDFVEVYWQENFEIYVTPVDQNQVGVALLTEQQSVNMDEAIDTIPQLKQKLQPANQLDHDRGWGPLYQTASDVRSENLFLVGDAAGYTDAITGEGLSIAFKESRLLSEAIKSEKPEIYSKSYKSIVRLPQTFIEALLWLREYPWLRKELMRLFAGNSSLFSLLLTLNDRGFQDVLYELIFQKKYSNNFQSNWSGFPTRFIR